ncbi:MAG: DUF4168 domain-containing protein [Spirochaetia bacterium]
MQRRVQIIMIAFAFLIAMGGVLTAQDMQMQQQEPETTDVSDEELEDFVAAYEGVQEIQQDLNEEINGLVEQSDLSQEEFQSMYQAETTNNQSAMSEMSEAKQQAFSELMNKINSLQQGQQSDMVEEIEEYDMSVERFNSIIAAIQQDSNLYQKFQEITQN